jgi:hypothetical protein
MRYNTVSFCIRGSQRTHETGIKMIQVRKKYGTSKYKPKILMLQIHQQTIPTHHFRGNSQSQEEVRIQSILLNHKLVGG